MTIMNCKFINVLMFAAGAAIGSAVTYKVLKTKYERIVQDEINSVRDVFSDMLAEPAEETSDAQDEEEYQETSTHIDWSDFEDLEETEDDDEEDLNDYTALVKKYTDEKGGAETMARAPYVIAPYDFGELDGYAQIELTYYADGVLEDDEYNIVTDGDEILGPKALQTFGEYEDDSVFVRNERLRTDFQILKDYRSYAEARSVGPGKVDDE